MAKHTDKDIKFSAIILAGDRGAVDPVARAAGLPRKCLVPVAGVPMIERVVGTLAESGWIERMAVVLQDPETMEWPEALRPHLQSGRLRVLAAAASPSRSALAAAATLSDGYPLLITTADHPLLSHAMLDCFCGDSQAQGADFSIAFTAASLLRAHFPLSRRTYLRFRGERYSGSNLFAVLTPSGLEAVEFWRRAEQNRKQPWRLAAAFGPRLLIAYLLRRYSLDDAMRQLSRRFGFKIVGVDMPFAEAAIDVDWPADLDLVERILRQD